jgi:hypothetical protein
MRFVCRYSGYPHQLAVALDSAPNADMTPHVEKFMNTPDCCLDRAFSLPLKHDLAGLPLIEQVAKLKHIITCWAEKVRVTTLKEEHWHAYMKRNSQPRGGAPKAFYRLSSLFVIEEVRRQFEAYGGRDLSTAPPEVCEVFWEPLG